MHSSAIGKWLMFMRDVCAIYSQYVFQHPIQTTTIRPKRIDLIDIGVEGMPLSWRSWVGSAKLFA
ncbi:MAG TPA: hypothetical protein DHW45_12910 [Candidatus Latescibacteria bacterium]|nr:hypothetical protein [Candidatus Latescibacterota bacterium]